MGGTSSLLQFTAISLDLMYHPEPSFPLGHELLSVGFHALTDDNVRDTPDGSTVTCSSHYGSGHERSE